MIKVDMSTVMYVSDNAYESILNIQGNGIPLPLNLFPVSNTTIVNMMVEDVKKEENRE